MVPLGCSLVDVALKYCFCMMLVCWSNDMDAVRLGSVQLVHSPCHTREEPACERAFLQALCMSLPAEDLVPAVRSG